MEGAIFGFFCAPISPQESVSMAVPVDEAIAALATFSLEDDQPDIQGLGTVLSAERSATSSPIEYGDVSAYRLSLAEDRKAINQLNVLIQEGKDMASVLYTYRSCVKALPQLPDSMKQSQADLYLETYQVLDLEMSCLRDIQRWQRSAASKLAADMKRFSRPERHINGPTITHLWSMLKLLDVLVKLDHLKNAKASIPNDFSWYKRTFAQVSAQWQDTDSMREELDDLQNDPVIPAFPDIHLSPAAILKELSTYFPKFASQSRLLSLAAPHEIAPRETHDYQRHYLVVNHISTIRSEHDDFAIRFASAMNKIVSLNSSESADIEFCKEAKGNMYDMVVEGFQLLSRWTGYVWDQCAWKFSRPCRDAIPSESSEMTLFYYEKVVRRNYTLEERKALVELIGFIKSIGSMMQRCDTLVADALMETIHAEVQDFVQNKLATMMRTTFRKKKYLSRILSDMRTLSADWMANTSKPETELQSTSHASEDLRQNSFYPRPVAPTTAQWQRYCWR